MQSLSPFIHNVFDHHLSWVGGILTLIGVGELLLRKKLLIPPKWVVRIGIAFLFVACGQAWFDEHRNVETLIGEKARLSGQVAHLQAENAFKDKPIILQVPQTVGHGRINSPPISKPAIEVKGNGNVAGNTVTGTGNVVGIGNQVTLNPKKPNAVQVTYGFNGFERDIGPGLIRGDDGEMPVFNQLALIEKSQDWKKLIEECDKEIAKVPLWMTPYAMKGTALFNLGEKQEGIKLVEYVDSQTEGNPDFDGVRKILVEMKARLH